MNVSIVTAYDRSDEVRELFSEYTEMLVDNIPSFKGYLELQKYDDEIKDLKSKYGMPYGRLYLAYYDGMLAGCIALKKIDESNCELKRLYVRPEFRGKKLGTLLVQKLIGSAREIGYSYVLLDTFPYLKEAIQLYKKLGFYEIERYNDNPLDTGIYMRFDLI